MPFILYWMEQCYSQGNRLQWQFRTDLQSRPHVAAWKSLTNVHGWIWWRLSSQQQPNGARIGHRHGSLDMRWRLGQKSGSLDMRWERGRIRTRKLLYSRWEMRGRRIGNELQIHWERGAITNRMWTSVGFIMLSNEDCGRGGLLR